MQTTLRSAFITDLLLPPPHSLQKLAPTQIASIGHDTALNLLHSSEDFIRSNPLVQNVRPLTSQDNGYIDVPAWCEAFNLNYAGDPERGVGSEWQQFEITDKLSWGLGSSDLIYVTAMRRIPGGFESVTSPGSGVKIYGRFEILRPSELGRLNGTKPTNLSLPESDDQQQRPKSRDYSAGAPNAVPGWTAPAAANNTAASTPQPTSTSETGLLHFIEHNETRCNALLSLYIKATNAKAHRTMHENFKRRWSEVVKGRLSEEVVKHGGEVGALPRGRVGEVVDKKMGLGGGGGSREGSMGKDGRGWR